MFRKWHRPTALMVALGMMASTIAPLLIPGVAAAQFQPSPSPPSNSDRAIVPAGTRIFVRHPEADKIIVAPNETLPVTLVVDREVTSSLGTILVPAGSEIDGQIQPVSGGSQLVAWELVPTYGSPQPIDATSRVITETEEISEGSNTDDILQGALIGAVAGSILAEILGDIQLLEVLLGAGVGAAAGAIFGGGDSAEVVVIYPDTEPLTLQSDLILR